MIRHAIASVLITITLSTNADDRVQHQPIERRTAGEQSGSNSQDRSTAIFAVIAIGIGVAIVLSRDTNGEPQTMLVPSAETQAPMLTYQVRFK